MQAGVGGAGAEQQVSKSWGGGSPAQRSSIWEGRRVTTPRFPFMQVAGLVCTGSPERRCGEQTPHPDPHP